MAAKKKAATKTELAEKQQTELALGFDMGNDAGAGMEDTDRESFAIPFLRVIQKMSPQVDEGEAEYMEDARPGMFLNTVTQQLSDGKEGVIFLPCAYRRVFLQWGARGTDAAGFKGEHNPEDIAAMLDSGELAHGEDGRTIYKPLEDGKVDEKKCDIFKDTRVHYGIVIDEDGNAQQCILSLSSTQIKKSKQLMSTLHSVKVKGPNGMVTPPTWANQVRITTVPESNDHGSWHGVKFAPEGFVASQDLYDAGKAFHEVIRAGEANVDFSKMDDGGDNAEGDQF